tara:strand:- start:51 stop:314 length:264 start_codon:yes stop_codon:yes gene_type:complete
MDTKGKDILCKFAKFVVDRSLSVPTIFILESIKYMSFIASQALVFSGPIFTTFINEKKYYNFTELLEDRNNVEFVIKRIEYLNSNIK